MTKSAQSGYSTYMLYPTLRLKNLTLRPFDEGDKDIIANVLETTEFGGFIGLGPDNDGNRKYIKNALALNKNPDSKSCVITVLKDDTIVGLMDVLIIKGEFDISGFIFPEHQEKGLSGLISCMLIKTIFESGITNKLEAVTHSDMTAGVNPDNDKLIYLAKNLGFQKIRVDSRFYDDEYTHQLVWLLTERDFKESPYFMRHKDALEFLVSESH